MLKFIIIDQEQQIEKYKTNLKQNEIQVTNK